MQFLEYRKHSTNTSLSVSILSSTALLVKIFTFPRRCASNAFVQWLLLFDSRWAARSTCYSSISRFMVYFREKNYHQRIGFSINLTIVYSNKRMTRMETLSRRSLRSHVIMVLSSCDKIKLNHRHRNGIESNGIENFLEKLSKAILHFRWCLCKAKW